MSLGENIRQCRKALRLTLEEVANVVGVNRQTMSRYENGIIKNIPSDKIEALAAVLETTPAQLMGWEESDALPAGATPYNPTRKVPLLGQIAAGLPLYAEQNIEGYVWTDRNHGAEYFALRVRGDSMNGARIYDGDIILVRRQNVVEDGEIAVILVNDDATIKRYHCNGSTVILSPQSTNPVHQPQIYSLKENRISILGKVVESRTEI